TQLKKQMTGLQDLGAELVGLNADQLASLTLPESLLDAVLEARRTTSFGARRRQLQYIGKLMRQVDPEPIRERLEAWKSTSLAHVARMHQIERWRDRLLADPAAVEAFAGEFPHGDIRQMRTLIRNALREREAGKPPRSYRALFQLIREIVDTS
ncbi:MAG: DUF615 domain-containing protein, partial [Burkholderiales bacterium]|nr:DUF615 domain-containing protein [Burkholderiales bacterium]